MVSEPDVGAGRFRFRTPSLRNVALTAPYMHSGVLATLEDVLAFYDAGVSRNPNVENRGANRGGGDRRGDQGLARVDGDIRRVDDMSEQEMAAIIAFPRVPDGSELRPDDSGDRAEWPAAGRGDRDGRAARSDARGYGPAGESVTVRRRVLRSEPHTEG